MILADTSVWVDYLRGADSTGAIALERAIGSGQLVLGDLIVAESCAVFRANLLLS
jgi:hypothetical protein